MRFKYGMHTILLFVDSLAPFSTITEELLTLLRERYPGGLLKSAGSSDRTPVPAEGTASRIAYGVLIVPDDPTQGWKRLKLGHRETFTPSRCGIKDYGVIAFTFVGATDEDDVDAEDQEPDFEVEWPAEPEEFFELEQ